MARSENAVDEATLRRYFEQARTSTWEYVTALPAIGKPPERCTVVVEGAVVYVGNGGPPSGMDVDAGGAPSLQDLLEPVEGRCVRVTIEMLDDPTNAR